MDVSKFWPSTIGAQAVRVGQVLLGVLVVIALLNSFYTVQPYQMGIVTTLGKFSSVEGEGPHLKLPFVQSVHYYRADTQQVAPEQGVNTYTADNQEADIVFTVFYRTPRERMGGIYANAQDFRSQLFALTIDRLKAEMGKTNLQTFADHRGEVRNRITDILRADAARLIWGLEVTDFQFTDVQYTKSFRDAVAAAATAKAGIETRENEKQQAIKTAERAKIDAEGKANAAREEAKGTADARLAVATAEAKAIQLEGEAKAAAMRAQARSLAENPVLVEMKKAEQWDGALPQQLLSGVTPFMQFSAPALVHKQ